MDYLRMQEISKALYTLELQGFYKLADCTAIFGIADSERAFKLQISMLKVLIYQSSGTKWLENNGSHWWQLK